MLQYFDIETITLRSTDDRTKDVPALTYGPFAICYALDGLLAVCHIPSGRRIRKVTTLLAGAQFIALLNGLDADWYGIDADWHIDGGVDNVYPEIARVYYIASAAAQKAREG